MNFKEIIKKAIPDANDAICDHILWGRTPFPFVKMGARTLYKAASGFSRACNNNRILCDFCHNEAKTKEAVCEKCLKVLDAD